MKAVEVIKKIAEDEAKKLNIVEMGIVTSIFPHSDASDKDNYECNVKLKNRDLELRIWYCLHLLTGTSMHL